MVEVAGESVDGEEGAPVVGGGEGADFGDGGLVTELVAEEEGEGGEGESVEFGEDGVDVGGTVVGRVEAEGVVVVRGAV